MATSRRGQALMELAAGMLALALVVSALCGFAVYIAKSLRAQNELRRNGTGVNTISDTVEVGEFAAQHFSGKSVLTVKEEVKMPERTILK